MKPRRILSLMHEDCVPPTSLEGVPEKEIARWKTEYDVVAGLEHAGHEVVALGVRDDLKVIRDTIDEFKPHVAFNLLEEFHGIGVYDYYVVSYLELLRKAYTGCNPRGLLLAHDKGLSKKILSYHRLPVPKFAVFPVGRAVRRSSRLEFPLLVKSLIEDASLGISHASIVHTDEKLRERVAFVHEKLGTDAIAEQYIDGRELYVGVLGNHRLQTFPIWEMQFGKLPEGSPRIATAKIKWDEKYQKRIGLTTEPAKDLSPELERKIYRICKRAYRDLGMTGYGRMDLRLTDDDRVYLIEANPNPNLAYGEDFAESAEHAGLSYGELLNRIVSLGLRYSAQWRVE
ncbi:MAG: ATP-grasp domain-containing protein [Phycisphaerales bacterium]|nr:MAG: ATP-grasp domain-containing protein [Phycisphaerales bacterium]